MMSIGNPIYSVAVMAVLALAPFPASAQQPTSDDLVKQLQEPPRPRSITRGLDLDQPAPPKARVRIDRGVGVTRDLTIEERETLADDVKVLKRPTADIEVYFAYDSAEITPEAKPILTTLGKALSDGRLKGGSFILAGHTDAKGAADYNLALSQRRAKSVREFLISNFAIPPESLAAVGYGKEQLKSPAEPFAALNRRVQVINWSGMAER